MSAKSTAGSRADTKTPYGHSARRGHGLFLMFTVVVLLIATAVWTFTYTRYIGHGRVETSAPATESARP